MLTASDIRSTRKAIRDFVLSREWLSALLVFSVFFTLFAAIYLPDSILSSSDDHFFHFRFASLMQQQGLFGPFEQFRSIYFSHPAEGLYYPYYNFLFYLAILPFTYISPLYLGIKLYAVCAVSVFFTTLYIAIRSFRIPYAAVGVASLFALMSTSSVWRLFLSRPYVLAPIFLLGIFVALYKQRWWLVAFLSFLYFFWYDATFFFPVGIAVIQAVFYELYTGVREWRGVVYALAGTCAALVTVYLVAPGFLTFIWGVITAAAATPLKGSSMPVGGEVFPIDVLGFIQSNALLFSVLLVGLCVELYSYAAYRVVNACSTPERALVSARVTVLFIVFGLLAAASLVTGRFIDYIFPFLGLYVVLTVSHVWDAVQIDNPRVGRPLRAGLTLALTFLLLTSSTSLDAFMAQIGTPAQVFEGVGGWLDQNTTEGDVVFNANWSWFPQLYYYSPRNYYVTGLDPHFLYDYDERRYWLWFHIMGDGYACGEEQCAVLEEESQRASAQTKSADRWYTKTGDAMADVLIDDFTAKYVVTSHDHERFNKAMEASDRFEKVYGDNRAYQIYKVLP